MFWDKTKATKLDYDMLAQGRDGTAFSPDLWKLEQHEYQLLFVPDQFMSRHPLHSVLLRHVYRNKPVASSCFTAEDSWGFWKYRLGKQSFPIPLINHNRSQTFRNMFGRIKGEVYAVRPYLFYDLDFYYQNRVEFVRHRTNIVVPYTKRINYPYKDGVMEMETPELTDTLRCWFYIGVQDHWKDMLDGGMNFSPVKTYLQHNIEDKWNTGRYFYWSLNEYEDS